MVRSKTTCLHLKCLFSLQSYMVHIGFDCLYWIQFGWKRRAEASSSPDEIFYCPYSSTLQNISLSASAIIVTGTEKGTKINTKCSPKHPPTPNMTVQRWLCRGQGLKNEVGGVGPPVRCLKRTPKSCPETTTACQKGHPKPTLGEHSLRRRSEANISYEKRANETPKRSKSPVQQPPPTDAKCTEKRTVKGNRTALRFFQQL